jgi:hypothetical protein
MDMGLFPFYDDENLLRVETILRAECADGAFGKAMARDDAHAGRVDPVEQILQGERVDVVRVYQG